MYGVKLGKKCVRTQRWNLFPSLILTLKNLNLNQTPRKTPKIYDSLPEIINQYSREHLLLRSQEQRTFQL